VSEDKYLRVKTPANAVMAPFDSILLERGTSSILVDIEGVNRRLILDTGSNISIMQPGISRRDVRVTPLKPFEVTGEALDVSGQQNISFTIGGRAFNHIFLVCSLPTEAAGLLGTDFMNEAGAKIDFECGKISINDIGRAPQYILN
jgi:hypothetical protein